MIHEYSIQEQFVYDGDFCYTRLDRLNGDFEPHTHDYTEMTIVLGGTAEHYINGRLYETRQGDVCVLQGNTVHEYRDMRDLLVYNVMLVEAGRYLPESRLRHLPGYQALFVVEPQFRRSGHYRAQLQLDLVQVREVETMVRSMEEEINARQPGYDTMVQAALMQLLVYLARAYEREGRSRTGRVSQLGKALAHMEECFREPMEVDELARMAGMSRRHFLRMFKQAMGLPPIEYVNGIRVRHAAKLLAERLDLNIGEAAEASGFNDSNYFSRRFRNMYGVSPRGYRGQMNFGHRTSDT